MGQLGQWSYTGMVCELALPPKPIGGVSCGINEIFTDALGNTDQSAYGVNAVLSSPANGTFSLNGLIMEPTDPGESKQINLVFQKNGFNNNSNLTCPLGISNQSYYLPPNGAQSTSLNTCLARQGVNARGGLRQLLGPGTFSLRSLMGV